MKRSYIEYDACKLSRLIESVYNREFNVAYQEMQSQRKITMLGVCPDEMPQELLAKFQSGINQTPLGEPPMFEFLLNDLCYRKHLEEGDYLICFDD